MTGRQFYYVVAFAACSASSAGAQSAAASDASDSMAVAGSPHAEHVALRSTIDRPSDAVRRPSLALPAPVPASSQHLGEAKTEMIVGGAAIITGAVIGGDGGSILMFGGAVVGLYGLWNYLK